MQQHNSLTMISKLSLVREDNPAIEELVSSLELNSEVTYRVKARLLENGAKLAVFTVEEVEELAVKGPDDDDEGDEGDASSEFGAIVKGAL